MTFEKPQKGNPFRLTIRQHTFPRASIARFASSSGRVHVRKVDTNKYFLATPDNALFCAKRVWDQRAEEGFNTAIERPFQALANAIVLGTVSILGDAEKNIINQFFALCFLRSEWKTTRLSNCQIPGAVGFEYPTTKDIQEELESRHVVCFGPDLTVPARSVAGAVIQSRLHQLQSDLADGHWGILRATKGEFLVADNLSYGRIVPISPVLWLVSSAQNGVLCEAQVGWLNRQAVSNSREYYFARDLLNCPV